MSKVIITDEDGTVLGEIDESKPLGQDLTMSEEWKARVATPEGSGEAVHAADYPNLRKSKSRGKKSSRSTPKPKRKGGY
jgi:hypothetical protein